MNCWHCNTEYIWQSDADFGDTGLEGKGIVSYFSCPKCESFAEVYLKQKGVKNET